jgi:hypothetical protein
MPHDPKGNVRACRPPIQLPTAATSATTAPATGCRLCRGVKSTDAELLCELPLLSVSSNNGSSDE